MCLRCKAESLPHLRSTPSPLCETCYLKKTARNILGSSSRWRRLKGQYDRQGGRCAYTGGPIIFGVNDSVDHLLPTSRFPDQDPDAVAVEWVTRAVNRMKDARTPEEFMALVRAIAAYRGRGDDAS